MVGQGGSRVTSMIFIAQSVFCFFFIILTSITGKFKSRL